MDFVHIREAWGSLCRQLSTSVSTSADAAMGPFVKSGVMMSNTAAFETLGWPVTALLGR